jgi:hypothetical protein
MQHQALSTGSVYQPSGNLGLSPLLAPALSVAAAVILAVAYGYILVYLPIVGYISVFILGALAAALGYSTAWACKISQCRNPLFIKALGLLVGLLAFYFSWAAFEYALIARTTANFEGSLVGLLLSPLTIKDIAVAINTEGWYTLKSWTPKGTTLWIFWGIEALVMIVGTPWIASKLSNNYVFCERCSSWCTASTKQNAPGLQMPESEEQFARLRAGELSELAELPYATEFDSFLLRVHNWMCSRCGETAAVRLDGVSFTVDDKGERSETVDQLTPILITTTEVIHSLGKVPEATSS